MYRYDVFLSYSRFDNSLVRRLMSDLKKTTFLSLILLNKWI